VREWQNPGGWWVRENYNGCRRGELWVQEEDYDGCQRWRIVTREGPRRIIVGARDAELWVWEGDYHVCG
jgi:hypothetical protein